MRQAELDHNEIAMGKSERPEHTNPPEIFYNEDEARKYTSNSRMIAIQVSQDSSGDHCTSAQSMITLCDSYHFRLTRSLMFSFELTYGSMWQEALTQRALELLALPDDGPKILLDLGCGSGLSGEELTEAGHTWVVRTRQAIWPLRAHDMQKETL